MYHETIFQDKDENQDKSVLLFSTPSLHTLIRKSDLEDYLHDDVGMEGRNKQCDD